MKSWRSRRFLSFPALTPISYAPENLNVSAALSNQQVGHALADLSLNVNSLPTGTLFQGAEGMSAGDFGQRH